MDSDLIAQLVADLHLALTVPARNLLGIAVGETIDQRIDSYAPQLAAQLTQDDDDRLSAQTVIDLMCALWPSGTVDPDWWRTPLGRVCARSFGRDDAESVSRSVAAAMLGVHPGTVAQMVHRGNLDRHPDGGVLRASVLQRLGR